MMLILSSCFFCMKPTGTLTQTVGFNCFGWSGPSFRPQPKGVSERTRTRTRTQARRWSDCDSVASIINGLTPMHVATPTRHTTVVETLIRLGDNKISKYRVHTLLGSFQVLTEKKLKLKHSQLLTLRVSRDRVPNTKNTSFSCGLEAKASISFIKVKGDAHYSLTTTHLLNTKHKVPKRRTG